MYVLLLVVQVSAYWDIGLVQPQSKALSFAALVRFNLGQACSFISYRLCCMERKQEYSPMHQVFTFSLVAKQEVSNIDVKIATTVVTIFKTKCFFNIITLFYTCCDIFTTTFFSSRRKRIPLLVSY